MTNSSDDSKVLREPSEAMPSLASLIQSSNLDERIAAAREQRQKLEAKKLQAAADDIPEKQKAVAAVVVPLAVGSAPKPNPVTASVELDKEKKSKGFAWVLVACCAALGFGLSVGAGIMIGSGLVSTEQWSTVATNVVDKTRSVEPSKAVVAQTIDPEVVAFEATAAEIPSTLRESPPQIFTAATDLADVVSRNPGGFTLALPSLDQRSFYTVQKPSVLVQASMQVEVPVVVPSQIPNIDVISAVTEIAAPSIGTSLMFDLGTEAAEITRVASVAPLSMLDVSPMALPQQTTDTGRAVTAQLASLELAPTYRIDQQPLKPREFSGPIVIQAKTAFEAPQPDEAAKVDTTPATPATLARQLGFTNIELAGVNLKLHAPDGVEDDVLQSSADALAATGFAVSQIARPGFNVSKSHLRFYNESDRTVAEAIASAIDIEARDFTSTSAPAGLVEVWIQGRSVVQAAPAPRRTANVRQTTRTQRQTRRVDPVTQLRNNLASQLRNGDHL